MKGISCSHRHHRHHRQSTLRPNTHIDASNYKVDVNVCEIYTNRPTNLMNSVSEWVFLYYISHEARAASAQCWNCEMWNSNKIIIISVHDDNRQQSNPHNLFHLLSLTLNSQWQPAIYNESISSIYDINSEIVLAYPSVINLIWRKVVDGKYIRNQN